MPKRTLQPSRKKRKSRHGFRKRMASAKGRGIIKRRTKKGRRLIS